MIAVKNPHKSFNHIVKDVKMNPGTLNRRLKELIKFALIEPIIVRVDDQNRIKYKLTKKGEGLIKDIEEFVRLYKKLDEAISAKS